MWRLFAGGGACAPARGRGELYTGVLGKLGRSEQNYRLALAQRFAAVGVVIILGKMDLPGALCKGRGEIG
jgi:hypothetical protein